ncbi:hypothetical protein B0A55_04658 [Friedmanniomyces simplex]|uniref:Mitochondrial thiamine pyrophosphate carrier 1 n=1 Tax=Friedmanniomyces simplex TaxID=329884 RepID=A0A4U0XHG7_9PEZI|nr:hypothetical protein B0A55_04658 [Friedmanniomyces simplex]
MDGESTEQREARLRDLWGRLDVRKKGSLDMPALKSGLQSINHPLKDADTLIRDMLGACDINHDGQITYDEFVRFCEETERQLKMLFDTIDRDKNGNLDKGELALAFERAGVMVSKARLDRFFGYIDKNHDGTIDFSEWRDFLLLIPANAPGLKAVYNYYTSTLKLTAEGDVAMSDQATSSLGMTLDFLKTSLFGAVIQLVAQSPPPPSHATSEDYLPDAPTFDLHPHDIDAPPNSDPHIPTKPARRKSQPPQPHLDLDPQPVVPLQLKLTDLVPDVGYFIAGGVSGITSRTATAPFDRLKVYLIAQTGVAADAVSAAKGGQAVEATKQASRTLWMAVQELWAAGGIRSLFAGNGINVVKVMPESAVKFGSYEACKRAIAHMEGHNDPRNISQPSQFAAGGVAGMISQAVVYPLDTLKFRMQCETVPGGEHGNKLLLHTAQKMWARNGIVAFYRGLPMGLVGMFPYAAIDLFTFETLKRKMVTRNLKKYGIKHEEDALPGNFTLALMGGFSGAIGASIVYPINLLRTRLQSQGTAAHRRTYTGIADVTRQTIKGEGVRGLFKGLTPNLLKVVPAVSITYVVYENCKKALHLH